jgi:glycosyltransferase involved in cell wall biosynthesis
MTAAPRGAVDVAMIGARMHYAVPRLLHEAGRLGRFYTDSYVGNKPWLARGLASLPGRLRHGRIARLLERSAPGLPGAVVESFDAVGFWFGWRLARARTSEASIRLVAERAATFNRRIIRAGVDPARVVWGYNGAALELFKWAKAHGRQCVLEQTIVPRSVELRLLAEELVRWPGWEPGLRSPAGGDPREAREIAEWTLADRIVGGSRFVIDGLAQCGAAVERCRLVPYGVDLARYAAHDERRAIDANVARPLRVLFAGEVGLRKGAPYLLEALRMLGPGAVDARFVGTVRLHHRELLRYCDVARFEGVVPRSVMRDLYDWADVFCLPSICEGSATATYEALAAGVPVVATPNAGSLVEHGVSGFIVPIRNGEAIAAALETYRADRELLGVHGQGATAMRDCISLAAYGRRLEVLIDEVMSDVSAVAAEAAS